MNWIFSGILVFCVDLAVKAKYLHMKDSQTESIKNVQFQETDRNDNVQFQDFYTFDNNVFSDADQGRFVRHVELVTESVLEHLMKELNQKYPHSSNDTKNSIPIMMKRLKMKLKKHMKGKKTKKSKKRHSKMDSTTHEMTTTNLL